MLTGTIVKIKRGRERLTGSASWRRKCDTVVVRRDYLHYITKYNRFKKRNRNISVHMSPCFRDVQVGDVVTVQ